MRSHLYLNASVSDILCLKHLSDHFFGCMGGPDLPRWIASSKCDSGAMLGAFLHYKQQCTTAEAEAFKELYSIEHADAGFAVINGQVLVPRKIESSGPSRPCSAPSCERCETLKGGYQFRWYSPKWDAEYRKGARPGSWCPGEPERDN